VHGLLAPYIAVINGSAAPFEVSAIHVELLPGERIVDARHFEATAIQRFAGDGPGIEEFKGADLFSSDRADSRSNALPHDA
jgi:hypothetical protein